MTESTDKREETLVKKYGSPEALAEKRKEWQAKSRKNYKGTGGFAKLKTDDPKKLKQLSKDAANKRWGNDESKKAA